MRDLLTWLLTNWLEVSHEKWVLWGGEKHILNRNKENIYYHVLYRFIENLHWMHENSQV